MWRAFKRKHGGPAAPASPAPKATPKERRQDSPPKPAAVQVPVEVIPKTIWMEQELQLLRRAGEWPHMTAQRAERLLDVGTGEVVELDQLEEAFDLIEELGCGECAVVYRAEHRQNGVEMALKVLHFGSPGQGGMLNESAEATALAMARNELLSLASLPRHQGIMQLLGVWCTSTQLAFGLELLDSGDLLVPIEESGGAIPEADALPLFAQLASAVQHMHANGWAHRDLKPENVCLCNDTRRDTSIDALFGGRGGGGHGSDPPPLHTLRVKIIDFGTAARCEAGTCVLRGLCGTPAYVAPEVALWSPDVPLDTPHARAGRLPAEYGLPADMWSLGVTLYVMLSGECPWNQELEPAQMLRQVAREGEEARLTSPAWSHVSAEAKQLVSAMLERRVDRRLTADEVLRHPWLASAMQQERARAEAPPSPGPRALLAPGALAAAVAGLGAPRASDGTTAEAEVEGARRHGHGVMHATREAMEAEVQAAEAVAAAEEEAEAVAAAEEEAEAERVAAAAAHADYVAAQIASAAARATAAAEVEAAARVAEEEEAAAATQVTDASNQLEEAGQSSERQRGRPAAPRDAIPRPTVPRPEPAPAPMAVGERAFDEARSLSGKPGRPLTADGARRGHQLVDSSPPHVKMLDIGLDDVERIHVEIEALLGGQSGEIDKGEYQRLLRRASDEWSDAELSSIMMLDLDVHAPYPKFTEESFSPMRAPSPESL